MYVPLPYLVIAGLALMIFAWLLLRRREGRDLIAPPARQAAPPRPVSAPAGPLEAQLRAQLAGGNKIGAIKMVREAFHLSLAEAKDLVEAVERGAVLDAAAMAPPAATADLHEELRRLLAEDRKIEAIKRTREALGLGLAEAKNFVESIEAGG